MQKFDLLQAKLARALEAAGVPYMVIGGMAVLVHGEPRFTKDVDLTLGVSPAQYRKVRDALAAADIRPRIRQPEKFVRERMVLPCRDRETRLPVDLSFTDSPYDLGAMGRAVRIRRANKMVRITAAEDLVIQKTIAGRPKDLSDIEGVLLRHKQFDAAFVRQWLQAFEEVLERPLVERFDRLWTLTRPVRRRRT